MAQRIANCQGTSCKDIDFFPLFYAKPDQTVFLLPPPLMHLPLKDLILPSFEVTRLLSPVHHLLFPLIMHDSLMNLAVIICRQLR